LFKILSGTRYQFQGNSFSATEKKFKIDSVFSFKKAKKKINTVKLCRTLRRRPRLIVVKRR